MSKTLNKTRYSFNSINHNSIFADNYVVDAKTQECFPIRDFVKIENGKLKLIVRKDSFLFETLLSIQKKFIGYEINNVLTEESGKFSIVFTSGRVPTENGFYKGGLWMCSVVNPDNSIEFKYGIVDLNKTDFSEEDEKNIARERCAISVLKRKIASAKMFLLCNKHFKNATKFKIPKPVLKYIIETYL